MEKTTVRRIEELLEKLEREMEERDELAKEFAKLFIEKLLPSQQQTIKILSRRVSGDEHIEFFEYYLTPNGTVRVYSSIDDDPYTFSNEMSFEKFVLELPKEFIPKIFETYLRNLEKREEDVKKGIEILKKAIECLKRN